MRAQFDEFGRVLPVYGAGRRATAARGEQLLREVQVRSALPLLRSFSTALFFALLRFASRLCCALLRPALTQHNTTLTLTLTFITTHSSQERQRIRDITISSNSAHVRQIKRLNVEQSEKDRVSALFRVALLVLRI
jgi:hypothetical protein